jgi:hypothetical protein
LKNGQTHHIQRRIILAPTTSSRAYCSSRAKVWDGCEFQCEEHRERVNEWDFTAMDCVYTRLFEGRGVGDDGKRKEEIGNLIRLHSHSTLFLPPTTTSTSCQFTYESESNWPSGTHCNPPAESLSRSLKSLCSYLVVVWSWCPFFEKTSPSRRPLLQLGPWARHAQGNQLLLRAPPTLDLAPAFHRHTNFHWGSLSCFLLTAFLLGVEFHLEWPALSSREFSAFISEVHVYLLFA